MRKKDLLSQNLSLFDQLQQARADSADLRKALEEKESKITELTERLEKLETAAIEQKKTEPFKRLEEKVTVVPDRKINVNVSAVLDDATQYGAEIIGKIVVSAAQYSNDLTVGGEVKYKELVNLILGRSEVAKSEILAIVTSDCEFEEKQAQMDEILSVTQEYFESVMAQKM